VQLSVIVPALNEAENIGGCLRSVRAQTVAEIVVVDGGSSDATISRAQGLARVIGSGRGRALQMNAGARAAAGGVLLFLHADTRLHPQAVAELARVLQDPRVVGGTFTLRFDSPQPLLKFYGRCTELPLRCLRFGDQGIFVRRQVFEALGGFRPLPLMEDVDFLRRLGSAGRLALVRRPVTTSARRFRARGALRQQLLNIALVLLYRLGVAPATLARWYAAAPR
jgi:rSAM/selenodomain-associated transferase 2